MAVERLLEPIYCVKTPNGAIWTHFDPFLFFLGSESPRFVLRACPRRAFVFNFWAWGSKNLPFVMWACPRRVLVFKFWVFERVQASKTLSLIGYLFGAFPKNSDTARGAEKKSVCAPVHQVLGHVLEKSSGSLPPQSSAGGRGGESPARAQRWEG